MIQSVNKCVSISMRKPVYFIIGQQNMLIRSKYQHDVGMYYYCYLKYYIPYGTYIIMTQVLKGLNQHLQ